MNATPKRNRLSLREEHFRGELYFLECGSATSAVLALATVEVDSTVVDFEADASFAERQVTICGHQKSRPRIK